MTKHKELEGISLQELYNETKNLILYNDDYNTFDYVIESLVNICNHDLVQAEQCAFTVHYNGKCQIKNGIYEKLKPMHTALQDLGLNVKII